MRIKKFIEHLIEVILNPIIGHQTSTRSLIARIGFQILVNYTYQSRSTSQASPQPSLSLSFWQRNEFRQSNRETPQEVKENIDEEQERKTEKMKQEADKNCRGQRIYIYIYIYIYIHGGGRGGGGGEDERKKGTTGSVLQELIPDLAGDSLA